jgi:microcystin-dependent protein
MEGYIGQMMDFAGNFCPRDWAWADGKVLPVQQYPALYSILGNRFGGDGHTTFSLPDERLVDSEGRKHYGFQMGRPTRIICVNGIYPDRE